MRLNGIDKVITREEALRLHREMWTDMQKELGDNPTPTQRIEFKHKWLNARGYSEVECSCFLCEYARHDCAENCNKCPIDWTTLATYGKDDRFLGTCRASCYDGVFAAKPIHRFAPISEILALPERSE